MYKEIINIMNSQKSCLQARYQDFPGAKKCVVVMGAREHRVKRNERGGGQEGRAPLH